MTHAPPSGPAPSADHDRGNSGFALELDISAAYFESMKRVSILLAACLLSAAAGAQGEDTTPAASTPPSAQELEENFKVLKGHVDDLLATQVVIEKRLTDLEARINDLRDQMSKPNANYASQDDLKRLADAIQEVDRKRMADNERVLQEFSRLASAPVVPPVPPAHVSHSAPPAEKTHDTAALANQNGFNYVVKKGDSLGLIAQTYREQQGIKVWPKDIEAANPGIKPKTLLVGQTIFIPANKPADSK
jgi:LysM repeat protein